MKIRHISMTRLTQSDGKLPKHKMFWQDQGERMTVMKQKRRKRHDTGNSAHSLYRWQPTVRDKLWKVKREETHVPYFAKNSN